MSKPTKDEIAIALAAMDPKLPGIRGVKVCPRCMELRCHPHASMCRGCAYEVVKSALED